MLLDKNSNMATMRVEDILRKKPVPTKYQPNSYRIFCDDIGNQSIPDGYKYTPNAPDLYNPPMIAPAQAIEDRNRPQGGRAVGFLRENARTLNEPVARVNTKTVSTQAEKRWWEWNLPAESTNPTHQAFKKRAQSTSNIGKDESSSSGYETTYQKDHGYLRKFPQAAAPRPQQFNPNANNHHAVGILPINDLNGYSSKSNGEQRVFVDKMSFEHGYDARKESNYPIRGKRQGAYVVEQVESQQPPRPQMGMRSNTEQGNKQRGGASVWDVMHMDQKPTMARNVETLPSLNTNTSSLKPNLEQYRNQRRDPIGYYEGSGQQQPPQPYQQQQQPSAAYPPMQADVNAAGMDGISYQTQALAFNNVRPDFQQQQNMMMSEIMSNNNNAQSANPNDLLENAMKYQRPIINGH